MIKFAKIFIFPLLSLSIFFVAQAQSESPREVDNFKYPIIELGNCNSKTECKAFCSEEENFESCSTFAEKHNLIPKEIKNKSNRLKEILKQGGPGGCKNREACENFCANQDNFVVCLEFGKKHGLISKEDEAKANKFLPLMKSGETPGKCNSKEACESYCHDQSHNQECIDFAVKIGALTKSQAEKAEKFNIQGPGGCEGKEECNKFCNNPKGLKLCEKL